MKRALALLTTVAVLALAAFFFHEHTHHHWYLSGTKTMIHARSEFSFTVHAPMATAFPLFGPEGERPWAGPHWDPQFLYPTPAKDIEGAVFHVHHGRQSATWINTAFDAQAGHAAYTYVIPGKLATRIDVQLTPLNPKTTGVRVMYERTALDPSAYLDVGEMSRTDPQMGPDWEKSIAAYLQQR